MGAKRREVSTDPNQPRCKHQFPWGECPSCRGKFGELVIDLDRLLCGPKPPPEFLGKEVTDALRRMRVRKEEGTHVESSST